MVYKHILDINISYTVSSLDAQKLNPENLIHCIKYTVHIPYIYLHNIDCLFDKNIKNRYIISIYYYIISIVYSILLLLYIYIHCTYTF